MDWSKEWENVDIKVFEQDLFLSGFSRFIGYIPVNTKKILDVGGGTGRYGIKFAKIFPDSLVYLTDISNKSVELMRSLSELLKVENVLCKQVNVLSLDFPDNFFDVVFCDVVIQHIPDSQQAISELKRVLKPGGRVIVSTMNLYNPHSLYKLFLKLLRKPYKYGYEKSYTRTGLKKLVGLKTISIDGFYPAYGILRLKKIHPIFRTIGKIFNRLTKLVDAKTNRLASRTLGFEIFVVAEK